jgi:hypothetical protein
VVAGSDRNTATRKAKKNSLQAPFFFAWLGVLIVGIHTNALRLFAPFFRRKPRDIRQKKKHYFLACFQKKRACSFGIYPKY